MSFCELNKNDIRAEGKKCGSNKSKRLQLVSYNYLRRALQHRNLQSGDNPLDRDDDLVRRILSSVTTARSKYLPSTKIMDPRDMARTNHFLPRKGSLERLKLATGEKKLCHFFWHLLVRQLATVLHAASRQPATAVGPPADNRRLANLMISYFIIHNSACT